MRSGRTSGHELLRLLAEVVAPVYLLDEQQRLVFMNQAAAEWLEVSTDDLLGRQCRYQSGDANPLSALADSLCPPPEVFHGQKTCGIISKSAANGALERRRADFIPLPGDANRRIGVLVVVKDESPSTTAETTDIGSNAIDQSSTSSDESLRLHELLQQFHREMVHRHHLDRLVGSTAAMMRVREQIRLAAAGNSTVLIVGPPGIGKRHVAHTIHATANQRRVATQQLGPLAPVSCSALPPDQLHSTISAFIQRNKAASDAAPLTLLLTDVDRLPVEVQPQITHWLDSGLEILRIISTACESLEALAERGAFRADLAQRLSTLVIELPPLVNRRDDIPLLAQMFLEDLNAQGGKQLRGFAPEAMDRLCLYDWPGQTDELSALIRQSFSQAEGFEITSEDLPKQLRLAAEAVRHPRPTPQTIDLEKFLTRVEAELIERALRQSKGNKSQAARLLGITRPRLYRRMVQLELAVGDEE
jgi:DNA-binding NtrC family response regulator